MLPTYSFQVKPKLPQELEALRDLASNLWFTWTPEAVDLFQRIDGQLWAEVGSNPSALLNQVSQERLEVLAGDGGFLAQLDRVSGMLSTYLEAKGCPFLGKRTPNDFQIAYFSAEYGIAECLPIYSGGLGMLSGDHLKSASDLNLPLIGVGLAYGEGYFKQYLNPDGWQQEEYTQNDFWNMPMALVHGADGRELRISVDIEGQELWARIWKVSVGRVSLYLMDANIEPNPPELRSITYQLYGGDREMRIRQEILLGIGGVRLLRALNIKPNVVHMNEGHSAFAGLELIRQLREEQGLNFDQAMEVVKAINCFTTHTPVPAGNDYFEPQLVQRHFGRYVESLGISLPVLLGFGRIHPRDQNEQFCMTVLALRMSAFNNGVSRLHGRVSRGMWKEVWPRFPVEDVPITGITNGVHIPTYISQDMASLYYRYLGPAWNEEYDSQAVWSKVETIPDAELWRVHSQCRAQTVAIVRLRMQRQLARRGASFERLHHAAEVLNTEALTIAFARRFATYKRALLLLSDPDRLARLLNDPKRPVQIIFAGKAHPMDNDGKEFIRRVVALSEDPRFKNKLVFIENYDINVARNLVQGADVWLNTPRRPLEACGTSGMKAAANGCLNLSVLDGWWDEGYEPGLGWAIGSGEEYEDEALQDSIEANALYRLLEDEVVPLFFERGDNSLPRHWIKHMKQCLAKVCPVFNTHRMLEDYAEEAYVPAALRYNALKVDGFAPAKGLGDWVRKIMEHWGQVEVLQVDCSKEGPLTWDDEIEVRAKVRLGGLSPDEVACEVYFGPLAADGGYKARHTQVMQAGQGDNGVFDFSSMVKAQFTGRMGVNVRVVPHHEHLSSKHGLRLVVWG